MRWWDNAKKENKGNGWYPGNNAGSEQKPRSSLTNMGSGEENNSNVKYTCRFDIQIENDREFQVARRLIGAKGINMKKIIDKCVKDAVKRVLDT